jgi:RNA polymerase sigma-54 factor
VEREDPSSPQSDDEIVAALALEGLTVARRTVAKYRGELGIPSSYRRRKYGQSSGQ